MDIRRMDGNGILSQGVIHNHTLYLCGQTARGSEYVIETQTAVVLEKIEKLLEKYGSGKDRILTATIYLKDISLFDRMNNVWSSWLVPGCEPARACIKAELASPELLVEIVVTAAI